MKMNPNQRRIVKFAALLLTSMLIGFASVAAYSEMFMHGTQITIGTAAVQFTSGGNTTTMGGANAINAPGTEVTFDNVPNIQSGEVRTYDQAVNITNNAGSSKTLNMSLHSISGNFSTNFNYLNITVINATGSELGTTIKIVSSGSNITATGNIVIPDSAVFTVRWIIKAQTGATNGEYFSITFKVRVD